jgi:hypothetical protein
MITVRVYKDQVGKWRWRAVSGSDIVGDSRQGMCAAFSAFLWRRNGTRMPSS